MDTLHERTFRDIGTLMHEAIGLSLAESKRPLVASRLAPRIARLGLGGFEDYLALISGEGGGGEFQMAVDLLTTNETYFFREAAHYELLAEELARERRASLRVWSAASSFGDEAYSTAMLLADLQVAGRIADDWQVLGTDISDRVLKAAVAGVYPEERLRHVTPARLRRHCLRGEGEAEGMVMIRESLRERVRFGQLNLMGPLDGLGPFDVVFLRNVLIYFDAATKRDVVDRVLATLRPGGLLFIGIAEGRVPCGTPLATVAPGAFRKPA
jgi:chemotaxis protein methyltransferase CheR